LLCSPGWPGTRNSPPSVSRVLGLQVGIIMLTEVLLLQKNSCRSQEAPKETRCLLCPGWAPGAEKGGEGKTGDVDNEGLRP
jgi:hypothetical protein